LTSIAPSNVIATFSFDRDTRSRFLSVATVKSRMQPGILLPVSYPISCVGSDPEVWKQSGQCSLIRKDGRQPVRRGGDSQHQGGRELGLDRMVNTSELPINVVKSNKSKMLTDLGQNGTRTGSGIS